MYSIFTSKNACRLVLAILANSLLSAHPLQPENTVKIFLLGGQSNMAGQLKEYWAKLNSPYKDPFPAVPRWHNKARKWIPLAPTHRFGPEVAFGHSIIQAMPNQQIRLIKYAINGTALYNDWKPDEGPQYNGFMQAAQSALANLEAQQIPYEIAGMLWLQGESDAKEQMGAAYEANLTAFILKMRSEFKTPDMPFIIARVRNFYGKGEQAHMVRSAQEKLAQKLPMVAYFDTDDLNPLVNGGHYNMESTIEIGKRFAAAYMKIITTSHRL